MDMNLEEYKKKVQGCWMGKNIGGTLGAPFECWRGVFDIDFYTQDLGGEPLPNDDLDLQLVWLNAVEKYGKNVNASILGEYWHTHIVPNWAEYGAGKNNMRKGMAPPLSGYLNNKNRNSCGAFIRSEIWACLAPGHPEIAVKYAYEDAIVDHSHEGVYAEVFCAALQSAAFVENDKFKLIEIGLSYIPEKCDIRKGVNCVIQSYQSGLSWQEARKKVLNEVPGSFGMLYGYGDREPEQDVPVGDMGYDAPSNIGLMVLGWLYGEDDFGKSLCIAVNCGEDADCTAATLGAILGIINGIDGIEQKWLDPIGNKIKTISINLGDGGVRTPKTIDELTERVIRQTPHFLGYEYCDCINAEKGYTIHMCEPQQLYHAPKRINSYARYSFLDTIAQQPFMVKHEFHTFDVLIDYVEEPYVYAGVPKKFKIRIDNKIYTQQWLEIKWYLPEGFSMSSGNNMAVCLEQYHANIGRVDLEFEIMPEMLNQAKYELILSVHSDGRHSYGLIPIVLVSGVK